MKLSCFIALLATGVVFVSAQESITPSLSTTSQQTVLSIRHIKVGKDTLIYNRVAAPSVVPRLSTPTVTALPQGDSNAVVITSESQKHIFLCVTANIYAGPITELVWTDGEDEKVYRVLSNIDFNHFPASYDFQAEDASYSVMVFTVNFANEAGPWNSAEAVNAAKCLRAKSLLVSKVGYDFVIIGRDDGENISASAMEALEAMHAYYTVNREKLMLDAAQRARDAEAQASKLAEEALKPKTITVNFWRESIGTVASP